MPSLPNNPPPRHFLCIGDIEQKTLHAIIAKARTLKAERHSPAQRSLLAGHSLAMIFEKNSTRTRVSFEVGMVELGGHPLILNAGDTQLGRGETVADTARVLSRYVSAIMLRCHAHATLLELAEHATVPVINGLSNASHPCQVMADILTIEEKLGPIAGKTLAWVGDGNNMAHSFLTAAAKFDFTLRLACPATHLPDAAYLDAAHAAGARIQLTTQPEKAVEGADAVIADTFVSMGDKDAEAKLAQLMPYQVNAALMAKAAPHALFLHCLPAHRGEEVTAEVLDGPQSVVWDEAENRLHVQKAILLYCLNRI